MPTYEYYCENCENSFEEFQSITAEPIKICPKCGGSVKRKIGAGAGLVFKGSGFYITDYKNKSSGGSDKYKTNDSKKDKKSSSPDSKKAS